MSRGLENYPNIDPPDSDYPSGRSKDNPGNNTGTPVKELTLGDYQQFFAKLMRIAGITPNNLPDNEYNGFQYVDAAKVSFQRYQTNYQAPGGGGTITIAPYEQALIYVPPGTVPGGTNVQLPDMADTCDGHTVDVVNDDPSETLDLLADVNIDYAQASPYTVPASSIRKVTLLKDISTWVISGK